MSSTRSECGQWDFAVPSEEHTGLVAIDGAGEDADVAIVASPPKRKRTMGGSGSVLTGRAPSTTKTRMSHMNLFDTLMAREFCRFDQLVEEDFQTEEDLQYILSQFVTFWFQNEKTYSKSIDYLCNVFGTVSDELIKKFPNSPGAKELKKGKWLEGIPTMLKNDFSRTNLTGLREDGLITKTYPIFRETDPRRRMYLTANIHAGFDAGDGDMKELAIDLASINETLAASDKKDKYKKMLALSLEWQFVSRADEPASMSYDKLMWDPQFDCAIIKLFQAKQLTCVPGTFCADYSKPSLNCLSNWAYFAMLEGGLVRPEGSFDDQGSRPYRDAMMIFQDESSRAQGAFGRLVLTAMRESIPNSLAHLKEKFSGKSIRYGAATHLHADRSITIDESIARGGWSTGTSRDHYVFVQLATMMAPMLSLAGFPDPTIDPVSPSLKPIVDNLSLPDMARGGSSASSKVTWHDITEFMDKLYLNNIPEFKPEGRLRPFLMAITASCIMDFEYQCKTYGGYRKGHDVCKHMCDKLCQAKLARGWKQAEQILIQWSRAIKTDFETRVASCASGSPKMKCMEELLRKCHQSLVCLQAENQRLETKLDHVVQEFAEFRDQQKQSTEKTEAYMKAILQELTSGRIGNTNVPQLTLSPIQLTNNATTEVGQSAGVNSRMAPTAQKNAFNLLTSSVPGTESLKKKILAEY